MMNDVMLEVDYMGQCNGWDSQRNVTGSWANRKKLSTQREHIETQVRTRFVEDMMSKGI